MSKLVRFDENHFGYLTEEQFSDVEVHNFARSFENYWPGKKLIVVSADEFIDLTGQYELVPIPDKVPA